jgi:hypothetical protein
MPKIGRIIGAILAIIGGGLITYAAISILDYIPVYPELTITFTLTLIMGILAIVGAILLLLDKTIGGILPIIAGAIIILGFWIDIAPFVPLTVHWASIAGIGFYLDPLLAIIGGIVGIAVGKAD